MDYKMIGETTNFYHTTFLEDGSIEIEIRVPQKFKWLWITKLNELCTTDAEIEYYQNDDNDEGTALS